MQHVHGGCSSWRLGPSDLRCSHVLLNMGGDTWLKMGRQGYKRSVLGKQDFQVGIVPFMLLFYSLSQPRPLSFRFNLHINQSHGQQSFLAPSSTLNPVLHHANPTAACGPFHPLPVDHFPTHSTNSCPLKHLLSSSTTTETRMDFQNLLTHQMYENPLDY